MKKAPTVEITVLLSLPDTENDRVSRWINVAYSGKEAAPAFGDVKPDHMDALYTMRRSHGGTVFATAQKDGTFVPVAMRLNGVMYDMVPRVRK